MVSDGVLHGLITQGAVSGPNLMMTGLGKGPFGTGFGSLRSLIDHSPGGIMSAKMSGLPKHNPSRQVPSDAIMAS